MKFQSVQSFCKMHIMNKKIYFFIPVIIMLIGMVLISKTIILYYYASYNISDVKKVFETRTANMYKLESGYISFDLDYYGKLGAVVKELEDMGNGIAIYQRTGMVAKEYRRQFEEIVRNEYSDIKLLERGPFPDLIRADSDILRAANLKDENGNYLELGVTSDGCIEVAVGSSYKGLLKIGDTFSELVASNELEPNRYIVKCFLKEGQNWFSGIINENVKIESTNTYMISSIDVGKYDVLDYAGIINNIFFFGTRKQVTEAVDYAKERGVFFSAIQFDDYLKECNKESAEYLTFSYILAILMFIIVIASIMIFSLVMWMADSKDIGILLSNGFTYRDILKVIVYENMIKLICPFIYLIYICYRCRNGILFSKSYIIIIGCTLAFVFLAATLICSYASYAYIRTKMPDKLLKGETV